MVRKIVKRIKIRRREIARNIIRKYRRKRLRMKPI
jgi:hypothetical protein